MPSACLPSSLHAARSTLQHVQKMSCGAAARRKHQLRSLRRIAVKPARSTSRERCSFNPHSSHKHHSSHKQLAQHLDQGSHHGVHVAPVGAVRRSRPSIGGVQVRCRWTPWSPELAFTALRCSRRVLSHTMHDGRQSGSALPNEGVPKESARR